MSELLCANCGAMYGDFEDITCCEKPTPGERSMCVMVNGQKKTRRVDYVDTNFMPPRQMPVLNEGEKLEWAIGQEVPMIFTVRRT